MEELHSALAKRFDVQMAAGATEIIEPDDLDARVMVEQSVRDSAPSETADSGEQEFHLAAPILTGSVADGFAAACVAFVGDGNGLNLDACVFRQS